MTVGGLMRRGSVDAFVGRHLVAWEGAMGVLAVVYLVVDVLADGGAGVPVAVVALFSGVFFAEFGLRFVNARSRLDYLRHHWLDLVSSMPLVGGLRAIRLLRLFRLVRAARALSAIEHEAFQHGKSGGALTFLFPVLLVAWFGAALSYWSLEHNLNADARTFGDALYWAFLTMTTVGYGTNGALHPETRVLAGAVIFVGIGLVSLVSGHLVSRLVHDDGDKQIRAELSDIRAELQWLRAHLEGSKDAET
ncbi:MAG TPA: ion transporter [Candidatus Angelobacter sp.]|nr:ion transporter [Candidatus Angelobacter sp.]